jgi:Flp pilus assembly pilin Flp
MEAVLRRLAVIRHGSREDGQALVEYALILGLVSVVAIALLTAVGQDITSLLERVTSALGGAI